jgi:hypothetical protein
VGCLTLSPTVRDGGCCLGSRPGRAPGRLRQSHGECWSGFRGQQFKDSRIQLFQSGRKEESTLKKVDGLW